MGMNFKIVNKKGNIFPVYAVDRTERGTYFLVWDGEFKWLSAQDVILLDETLWG